MVKIEKHWNGESDRFVQVSIRAGVLTTKDGTEIEITAGGYLMPLRPTLLYRFKLSFKRFKKSFKNCLFNKTNKKE